MNWESFYKNYRNPDYIPGYQLLNKLGGGVFGFVYKARKESIGKIYAIKFLKVDDEDVKRAVLHELEAIRFFAQVDHPHLVSIEDKGEIDGIPFIIMGYAGEETLKRRLEERRPGTDQALGLFRQILEGVAALHEKSIIHFDLKPGNVFLKGDFVRVGDYGLSRLMSESRKTLSFGRGTPYYMAPELLKKKGDARSDIYSLGVILFECLTGEVPFQGDSEWEVLKKHEEEQVTFPAGMKPEICAIIERMLAKDPEARYQSVKEILPAIDAVLTGASVGAAEGAGSAASPDSARVRSRASRMPERRRHCNPQPQLGNMLRNDIDEMKRVFHLAHKEVRSAGAEIGAAAAEIGGAFKEVKVAGGKVATSLGDHLRQHFMVPARRGLDRCCEGLVCTIAGTGEGRKAARSLERQLGLADPDLSDRGFFSLLVGNIFRFIGMLVLVVLLPFRFVGAALLEVLEFIIKLPYRVFGFLGRMVLVVFGVGVLFFSIFAVVYLMANLPRMFIRF